MNKNNLNKNLMFFVLPALVFYLIFMVYPIIGGTFYSFTDWGGLGDNYNFIGFKNYIKIFSDEYFLDSIWFTFKYTFFVVILTNVLALFLAMMIEKMNKSKGLFRTIFFLPNMISLVISSFIWVFIFSKILPELAESKNIVMLDVSWLGNPKYSFWAILTVSVWAWVGYLMIIYTASIQGIPQELKESARIDGASSWQVFQSVIIPLIRPAMTICVFIALNWGFKAFEITYALTNGGPGKATETMSMNIYYEAFSNKLSYGYANAKAIMLVVIMLIIAGTQIYTMKKGEVDL